MRLIYWLMSCSIRGVIRHCRRSPEALQLATGGAAAQAPPVAPLEDANAGDRALLHLFGKALIRGGQLPKGEALVDRILRHGDSAEARLMLGTAHMTGRDFAAARLSRCCT